MGRQTKVLILKSITTLNDATVTRILEKSDWNLRRAIEAFYIAKYKTQEYLSKKEKNANKHGGKKQPQSKADKEAKRKKVVGGSHGKHSQTTTHKTIKRIFDYYIYILCEVYFCCWFESVYTVCCMFHRCCTSFFELIELS